MDRAPFHPLNNPRSHQVLWRWPESSQLTALGDLCFPVPRCNPCSSRSARRALLRSAAFLCATCRSSLLAWSPLSLVVGSEWMHYPYLTSHSQQVQSSTTFYNTVHRSSLCTAPGDFRSWRCREEDFEGFIPPESSLTSSRALANRSPEGSTSLLAR